VTSVEQNIGMASKQDRPTTDLGMECELEDFVFSLLHIFYLSLIIYQ
jgi:hypothetical protein